MIPLRTLMALYRFWLKTQQWLHETYKEKYPDAQALGMNCFTWLTTQGHSTEPLLTLSSACHGLFCQPLGRVVSFVTVALPLSASS